MSIGSGDPRLVIGAHVAVIGPMAANWQIVPYEMTVSGYSMLDNDFMVNVDWVAHWPTGDVRDSTTIPMAQLELVSLPTEPPTPPSPLPPGGGAAGPGEPGYTEPPTPPSPLPPGGGAAGPGEPGYTEPQWPGPTGCITALLLLPFYLLWKLVR